MKLSELIIIIMRYNRLGDVLFLAQVARGVENSTFIVNDRYVIRLHDDNPRYQTEQFVYDWLQASAVPVPEVIALDSSKSLIPYDYLITTRLAGQAAHPSQRDLSSEQQNQLGFEIGQALATIHQHTFITSGMVNNPVHDSWWDVYRPMVARFIEKHQPQGHWIEGVLPRIEAIVDANESLLRDVKTPALLHGDFQLENVLQHNGHLTGIIDMEWAIIGDFACDFATDYHWRKYTPGCADAIYDGYRSIRQLTDNDRRRIAIYRLLPMLADALYARQIGWMDGAGWYQSIQMFHKHLAALDR